MNSFKYFQRFADILKNSSVVLMNSGKFQRFRKWSFQIGIKFGDGVSNIFLSTCFRFEKFTSEKVCKFFKLMIVMGFTP